MKTQNNQLRRRIIEQYNRPAMPPRLSLPLLLALALLSSSCGFKHEPLGNLPAFPQTVRDGLNRVARTQQADSLTRRRAARRLGGLCGTARTFIVSGRPKMQPSAYADSLGILAKQLRTRLDSLTALLPKCEQTAGRDPTVANTLTTRLKNYDDALVAFRTALKPDSAKAVSTSP